MIGCSQLQGFFFYEEPSETLFSLFVRDNKADSDYVFYRFILIYICFYSFLLIPFWIVLVFMSVYSILKYANLTSTDWAAEMEEICRFHNSNSIVLNGFCGYFHVYFSF